MSLQSAGLPLWQDSLSLSAPPPPVVLGPEDCPLLCSLHPNPSWGQGVVPRVVLMLHVLGLSGPLAFSLGTAWTPSTAIVTLEL